MTNVIIYGLRRSGTTILWETLRQSPDLTCYDEPFHPRLADGAMSNHKGTWTEFEQLLAAHPQQPQAIQPTEELDPVSSDAQKAWLASLCRSDKSTVIDIVRGWNRAPDLHADCKKVLPVQLVRDPASWIAAHLLPSGAPTFRRRVAGVYRRASFFTRKGFYDNYQYQTIIDAALAQRHPVFDHVAVPHDALSAAPAFMKLLAFWWGANVTLARNLSGGSDPHLILTLRELSQAPDAQIARISAAANWPSFRVSTAAIRVGRPAYGVGSAKWQAAATRLGIPPSILTDEGSTAAALGAAFLQGSAR